MEIVTKTEQKKLKVNEKIIVKHLINRTRYNIKVEAVTIANFYIIFLHNIVSKAFGLIEINLA